MRLLHVALGCIRFPICEVNGYNDIYIDRQLHKCATRTVYMQTRTKHSSAPSNKVLKITFAISQFNIHTVCVYNNAHITDFRIKVHDMTVCCE